MRVTMVGAGYVGLVSGVCLATSGNHVTLVDLSNERIDRLRRGEAPIYEPGLQELLQENIRANRLEFTTELATACAKAEVIAIAVGTPSRTDGTADLAQVFQAAETIARHIESRCVVLMKSTVPVGTGERLIAYMRSLTEVEFDYVANPEFLKEGTAVKDFLYPERIVIGAATDRGRQVATLLYKPFVRRTHRILRMDVASAELAKYACNAMLATRISFMNEMSQLVERVGGDIENIRDVMGSDSRIGNAFLYAGLGFGGSCFPKDVRAIVHTAEEYGARLEIVKAAGEANNRQITFFFNKIRRHFDNNLRGRKLAVWGLAFKPMTDDIREAPALRVIGRLLDHGADVHVHDPEAMAAAREVFAERVQYADDPYEACRDADALVLCTEWLEYRSPDFAKIAEWMNGNIVFDGRNLYDREFLREYGLDYVRIG